MSRRPPAESSSIIDDQFKECTAGVTQQTIGGVDQVNFPLYMKLLDLNLMKESLFELVLDTHSR